MRRPQKWPPDITARLVVLRDQGMSFDAIAERLREETGLPFSRDMVAGKVGRLALPQRPIRLDRTGRPDIEVTVQDYVLKISVKRLTANSRVLEEVSA